MQQTNNSLILLSLLLIIVLIITLLSFIVTLLKLYFKKINLFSNILSGVRLQFEQELYKAQLEIQEQTFQFVAREIHDNVGQFLALAKLNLHTLDFNNRTLAELRINNSADLLSKALDDLRDLSKSLSSELIVNAGLYKAVEMQLDQLKKVGSFDILFETRGNYQCMSSDKEIILFRILQESINNIVRHAQAKTIAILLGSTANSFIMNIRDDGKGFDKFLYEKNTNYASGGLSNIKKRVKLIGAKMEINSSPGKGTDINIIVSL
jgi:two-component system NarL family sensor kinase